MDSYGRRLNSSSFSTLASEDTGHVYKRIWAPVLGEELLCEPEFGKG